MEDRGTWEDVIRDALLELGAIDPGEDGIRPDELADVFRRLRGMMEEWALSGLLVPGLTTLYHTFPSEVKMITIGPAESNPDIVIAKPLEEIYIITYFRNGEDNPSTIKKTSINVIETEQRNYSYYPRLYFYNKTYPKTEILFDANVFGGDRIVIRGRGHFLNFQPEDPISDQLPFGYREGIMLNLAVKISSAFGVKDGRSGLSTVTKKGADKSMKIIRTSNHESSDSTIDPSLRYTTEAWTGGGGRRGYFIR